MNIVICEDNDTFRHTIEKITSEYTIRTKSNSVCTLSTADGEKVLEYIRKNSELTIYFLDIQLNGSDITGFDIAK
jgi:DNA-binding LytR/AlgR family response regulator